MNWIVGVTSAPRLEPTLKVCVDALSAAGWKPVVYAEPRTLLDGMMCAVVQRESRLGVWFNWLSMARDLASQDGVTHVLTIQDDAEVVPFARDVLERFEWPDRCAFISLYLPKHHVYQGRFQERQRPAGIQHIPQQVLHGSVALAWRVEALRAVVQHPTALGWPGYQYPPRKHDWQVEDDDICIGNCVNELGLEMWYAVPGLCQHVSTHAAREREMGIRRSPWVAQYASELNGC